MATNQIKTTSESSKSQSNNKNVSQETQKNNDSVKEYFGESIVKYTSEEAEIDGILFDITRLNSEWKKGLFNYVTTNLLGKGYLETGKTDKDFDYEIRISNILDLLNQSLQIVKKESKNFKEFDTFFSGEIELPNGESQKVFIQQNETGKFTIMLPQDY